MNYKKLLEENLNIELNEFETKRKYLNYLEKLKDNVNIIIPDNNIINSLDNNDASSIMEYAIEKSGGDSSNVDMEEINLFINKLNNGYYLLKYIEEIKNID